MRHKYFLEALIIFRKSVKIMNFVINYKTLHMWLVHSIQIILNVERKNVDQLVNLNKISKQ